MREASRGAPGTCRDYLRNTFSNGRVRKYAPSDGIFLLQFIRLRYNSTVILETSTMEEWRAIPGFEGLYEVSDYGRFRSPKKMSISVDKNGITRRRTLKPKMLRPIPTDNGYLQLILSKSGARAHWKSHNLVLLAFVGSRPEGHMGCHNNGNRRDNRLANLRYDTAEGNQGDRVHHGTSIQGHRHPRAKLSVSDVLAIRSLRASGAKHREIADIFGVSPETISGITNRYTWRHI